MSISAIDLNLKESLLRQAKKERRAARHVSSTQVALECHTSIEAPAKTDGAVHAIVETDKLRTRSIDTIEDALAADTR